MSKYKLDGDGEGGTEDTKTKFDTGLGKVFRIDREFQRCNTYSRHNNLDMWHKSILNLYKEGYPKWASNKTGKNYKHIAILEKHEQAFTNIISTAGGMHALVVDPKKFPQAWHILHAWELDLRRALDAIGLDIQDKEHEVY